MLAVISPAKRLDEEPGEYKALTQPEFQNDAAYLADMAGQQGAAGLKKLMGISDTLAQLNEARFAAFDRSGVAGEKPAALLFSGDTYAGLEAETLDEDARRWAQDHLRILSGLYGLLRPLDAIQPYRLEMGTKLANERGKSLYDYWGDQLAQGLTQTAQAAQTDVLVNCASVEYFRAADTKALNLRVITPVFMELRDGTPKIISFFAKKARGAMARFMMENRLKDPESLTEFDAGGYRFDAELSKPDKPVFLRDGAA
ncbi:hypothetical protein ATO10_06676 [Actibacterium atlanticum]|uniref:UPF0246 protein ATO10_06676 n=1 Tax=Actibacterium atlanticum TaxID=1461693 RepID=A0A058ZP58_9RHOB|nr:peroxide stress protein YaaA [Actibacterium atlanticum]KCV82606.1 hypothetical protein ATO10_06676 [Actibacterium atlanticum]